MNDREFDEDRKVIDAATAGPWMCGRLLSNRRTARWSAAEKQQVRFIEERRVFANFSLVDQGRDRIMIARLDQLPCVDGRTNTAFIARARTRWPAALDEIEIFKAALKMACEKIEHMDCIIAKDACDGDRSHTICTKAECFENAAKKEREEKQ